MIFVSITLEPKAAGGASGAGPRPRFQEDAWKGCEHRNRWYSLLEKSGHSESNQGPSDCCNDLQSDALPTEL